MLELANVGTKHHTTRSQKSTASRKYCHIRVYQDRIAVEEKQQTEDTVLEQDWTDLSQASFVQYQDLFVIMWLMM